MTANEVKRKRERSHVSNQHVITNDAGGPKVILKILSSCAGTIVSDALTLGEQLLCARNYNGQGVFHKMIDKTGRDGSFFVAVRNTLRLSKSALKEYRTFTSEVRESEEQKDEGGTRGANRSNEALRILRQLCSSPSRLVPSLLVTANTLASCFARR